MKTVLLVLSFVLLLLLALAVGAFYALRAALAPLPGEWSVPLRIGFTQIEAGVPSLVRLATSPWGGPLLRGRSFATPNGTVSLDWHEQQRVLQIRCAPCILQPPGLGREALQLAELHATVRRQGELLHGEAWSGKVRGQWQGEMAQGRLRLRLAIGGTPLTDGYALFAAHIPELQRAQISGQFSLKAQITLPGGTLTVAPRIDGFDVAGLGTEAFAGARSNCGRRASKLTPDSWLARAVIAAEDQRFFDHPGYDLAELSAALARNHEAQRIERGASTLSQQAAKLLVTGDERSPVRKLREVLYAVEMERTLGKARILKLYLDNAPWGMGGLCGAEAAAVHYFAVRAHELTPSQAAWLAAMLHNPAQEAQRWAASGEINLARAQWVALNMRGIARAKKLALAEDMAILDWTPWWAEPELRKNGSW
jgi:hypothetical protein